MNKKFHYLVRGVILHDGQILLAKANGSSNTFLPGGHVDIGEKMHDALRREINEEIGQDISIHRYLGVIEHSWRENEVENFEINHLFSASLKVPQLIVRSLEPHLEVRFHDLKDLGIVHLKPEPLVGLLRKGIDEESLPWFASTF